MRLALYEPDIAQNTGSILRLGACVGVPIDIIEPCGFVFGQAQMKRAGMDYIEAAHYVRHTSWETFLCMRTAGRIVLLSSKADIGYPQFAFAPDDTLLLGRESAGVPGSVHKAAGARLRIPMQPGMRSLNVAMAAAIVASEALRQTNAFPR